MAVDEVESFPGMHPGYARREHPGFLAAGTTA